MRNRNQAIKCSDYESLHQRRTHRKANSRSGELPSKADRTIYKRVSLYRILPRRWISNPRYTGTRSSQWSKTWIKYLTKSLYFLYRISYFLRLILWHSKPEDLKILFQYLQYHQVIFLELQEMSLETSLKISDESSSSTEKLQKINSYEMVTIKKLPYGSFLL